MIILDGIVKGLGYVWVGFGLGGKDDENKEEKCAYLRKFIFPLWSFRRKPPQTPPRHHFKKFALRANFLK